MLATDLIKKARELQTEIYTALEANTATIKIYSPEDVIALLAFEMQALEQEELRVLVLDTKNQVRKILEIYKGTVNHSQVRIAELFKDAIRHNAVAIIVVHNHPSGCPDPSPDDISLTKAILAAGKLLDIQVLDHIIIAADGYSSLARREGGFNEPL